jgi:hypothetical protein
MNATRGRRGLSWWRCAPQKFVKTPVARASTPGVHACVGERQLAWTAPMMCTAVGFSTARMVLLLGAAYALIGVLSGQFSDWAGPGGMRFVWRWLAWLVSGVAFMGHIAYGHFRLRNSPGKTAMQASAAAALGAGGLAGAANMHEWMTASRYRPSIALALLLWPLLTAIPAFVAAMIAATMLHHWRRP